MSVRGRQYAEPVVRNVAHLAKGLDLSGCELRAAPPDLGQFGVLQRIDMSWNRLESVPAVLFELPSLKECNLSHNAIVNLVRNVTFDRWTALTSLNLSFNSLFQLPATVGELKALQCLNLCNNELKEVPIELCSLVELRELHLANNMIAALPKTLAKCKNLRVINVQNNQLTGFPEVPEGYCRDLEQVLLKGNPLAFPVASLCRLRDRDITMEVDDEYEWPEPPPEEELSAEEDSSESEGMITPRARLTRTISSTLRVRSRSKPKRTPLMMDETAALVLTPEGSPSPTRTRSRSRSDVSSNPRRSPRMLKRKSGMIRPISLDSETRQSLEFEMLPKDLKASSMMDFVVENEAAMIAAATSSQLIALLTFDAGIGMTLGKVGFSCPYVLFRS